MGSSVQVKTHSLVWIPWCGLKFNPVIAEIIWVHHILLYCMLISFADDLVAYGVAICNNPLVLFSLDASWNTDNS